MDPPKPVSSFPGVAVTNPALLDPRLNLLGLNGVVQTCPD